MKPVNKNKLPLKILSAVIAILLWFAITYTEDPIISQGMGDIPIVFAGEDTLNANGLIIVNKDSLPNISVIVRGNRSSVISAMQSVKATIDVSGISASGEISVPVGYTYPEHNISLEKSKIREVTLEVEKIVSREIDVLVETKNTDKNDDYIIDAAATTKKLTVRGAESTVYKIAYAKVQVDVSAITADSSQAYFYKFYDESGDVLPEDDIVYTSINTIEVSNTAYKKATLPVRVVLSDRYSENYAITKAELSFSSVTVGLAKGADATELVAILDTMHVTADTALELALVIPDGVYVPEKYRTVTAHCDVEPKVVENVEVTIKALNVPDGKTVTLENEKIAVSVKGAKDKITTANITGTVDVSLLSADHGVLDVTISAPDGVSVIGSYAAAVTIK